MRRVAKKAGQLDKEVVAVLNPSVGLGLKTCFIPMLCIFRLKAAISRGKPHPRLVCIFSASPDDGVETQKIPGAGRAGRFGHKIRLGVLDSLGWDGTRNENRFAGGDFCGRQCHDVIFTQKNRRLPRD